MSGTPREAVAAWLDGYLRPLLGDRLPPLELVRPPNRDHGDYAVAAGQKLAAVLRRPPAQIASEIAQHLGPPTGVASVEAVDGYLNFRLTPEHLRRTVGTVAARGPSYGSSDLGAGQRVQVEFASINPTGPLHIGNGRGAILGDALASLLTFAGFKVEREYYVNDYGSQARKFGQSIYARLCGAEPPPGGYLGGYVTEIAHQAEREIPGLAGMSEPEAVAKLGEYGSHRVVEQIREVLGRLRIQYDQWFSERSLWTDGLAPEALDRLRQRGFLKEKEGAVWFAPAMEDGAAEDEDRVVIRSDGSHTYLASDLGYALSRLERRGFGRVIEVWGADHHGYVPRFESGLEALGLDPDRVVIILHQLVNLKEGKMSKRQGRFVTLDELIDRVGVDAVRFFYLLRSPDAMMDFDLELAASHKNENPVYYAQYAHARLANVEPVALETYPDLPLVANLDLLVHDWELAVARQVAFWPETVADAARMFEPHRIPYYVRDLADAVHFFYQKGNQDWQLRVVVDGDPELTRARLELCRAARHTLRSALDLMSVSAPDRM